MRVAWHPSRYWDWRMSEGEKKRDRKIVGIKKNWVFCEYENVALQAQKVVYQVELVSVVCPPLLNPWVNHN